MFKINYDEANEFEEVQPGDYEVIVAQAVENVTPNGAVHMDIQLAIRNDIKQKFQNQRIFHKVFQKKETGEYPMGFINVMAKALQLPDGKSYAGVEDLLDDFKGKVAKVRVGHREYKDKKYAEVKSWYPTSFPQVNHDNGTNKLDEDFTEVKNEDVPF